MPVNDVHKLVPQEYIPLQKAIIKNQTTDT